MNKANTINEVIFVLEHYIDTCYETKSPMGYFASLYTRVTLAVKQGIDEGIFQDNERMERLDVNFANYFLNNLDQANMVWQSVFDQAQNKKLVISQHLLLGMNAHINYDLAFATFETQEMSKEPMNDLYKDYLLINTILQEQIDAVQERINRSWWVYRLLDKLFLRFDEIYIQFRLICARDSAWEYATKLHVGTSKEQIRKELESLTHDYLLDITKPSWLFKIFTAINRFFESQSVRKNIDLLRP
ncbi:MAG: DUF5995 family protein [Thiovulaceae bacterium]|nr:DUF5995 family protein [Sulfurimonadaceae bacterium]